MLRGHKRMLQRGIIFINQNCDLHPTAFVRPLNNPSKTVAERHLRRAFAIDFLISSQRVVKIMTERIDVRTTLIHAEVKHRPLHPLFLYIHYPKPLKEIAPSFEITLHGRREQRLAEAPGSAQEIILITIGYFPKHISFVHVEIASPTQLFKVLYAQR